MRGPLSWMILVAALSFAGAAHATQPPAVTSAAAGSTAPATEGTPGVTGEGILRRPALLGLIAALFLICGAIVGDKHHHGHKPKSRR